MKTIVHLYFVQGTGAAVSKIEVRAAQRLIVKRVQNGNTDIVDFDFSNLSLGDDSFSTPGGKQANSLQQAWVQDANTIEFKLVSYIPEGIPIPDDQITEHDTFPGYPYLAVGETETAETPTVTPSWLPAAETDTEAKKRVRDAAVAHARGCIDAMNAGWVIDNAGAVATSNKWRNTRLWILSGLAVIDAILKSSDANWGYDAGKNALDVYRTLIPLDRALIETWYLAHSEAIWNVYFTETSGNVPAYFKWANGSDIPAFASDASSSTAWDGTSNTLDVDFAVDSTPEDFSS